MQLLGFSMTNPGTLLEYLKSINKSYYILPLNSTLSNKNKESVVCILDYHDLKNNLKTLNSPYFSKTVVFIFAPTPKLRSLKGIEVLDIDNLAIDINQPFKFKTIDLEKISKYISNPVDKKVSILDSDDYYVTSLIDHALSGSILTKLMTLLYQIPNSKIQNDYRDRIIGWFVNGDSKIETVEKSLLELGDKKIFHKLMDLIRDSQNYKEVFLKIKETKQKNKSINFGQLSTQHGVIEFDLRYMLSIANSIDLKKEKNGKDSKLQ